MLRCVSLRVLAASCSLPPSGGRPRAALRRGRGLLRCFGRCGGLAFRSAGGRCPPRRCPPSFAAPCSPSGCCASLRPRSPSGCAGLLLSCPRPAFGRRVVAAVAARRARSLAPRRAAAFGGVAVRPCGVGAVPPSAPCSRVSPPSGASPRRFRSASPVACRRRAASARVAPAVPARRCGGLRRSGGRGGAFGGRCGGRLLWRFAPPRVGFGVSAAAAAVFSRLLRFGFARAALCLAFGCGFLRADGRATAARPFCASGAFCCSRRS